MKAYVGVVTVDTIEHNDLIVDRHSVERMTEAEALADARALIASNTVVNPRDSITDLHASFIVYES